VPLRNIFIYFFKFSLKNCAKLPFPNGIEAKGEKRRLPRFGKEVNNSWSLHYPKRKPSGISLTAFAGRYCARNPEITYEK
jgi:hypothetical protein